MEKVILHCDLNGFYAAVELLSHPQYKNMPVAVCGDPKSRRGIILAKNDLAKPFNIKTGEPVWQAMQKCKDLVLLKPHHDLYYKYSLKAHEIYLSVTNLVEPFGIDEAWLDVTASQNLFGNGKEIADLLRKRMREELGLTISAGVSWNKVFAKLGSDYKKPDATTVINKENYKEIVFPLKASDLLFVGKSSLAKLAGAGILTIGDIAAAGRETMTRLLQKQGDMLYSYASGMDCSPVLDYNDQAPVKSVGNGMTFKRDVLGARDVSLALATLSDKVASRLRAGGLVGRVVSLSVKSFDFQKMQRQMSTDKNISSAKEIKAAAEKLFFENVPSDLPIRSLTVTVSGICDEAEVQLSLFDDNKSDKLERAVDSVKQKFGRGSIVRGSQIRNDLGIIMDDEISEE